ncbi:zinc finger protein 197-like [Helicoverpa zea]|uniref:zinc finger protein 197-like n=1 Tax=Helicoverpa zea TaxID=7113 RepID=UPI001F598081|nr:zinc finger protein 197-like [Helicoverpa zea]
MDSWNCCRACLGVEALHPIFQLIDHHEKYTDVIFSATGLKVEYNDALPQKMCTSCINFINASYKFRKKCEENQKSLISRLNEKPQYEIKIETNIFDVENNGNVSIDISDLINYIDVHVVAVASYNYDIADNIENNDIEFETKVEDIVDKPVELIFKSKKSKNCKEKPVKRSLRKKKENGEKKERCKEEIECEYCHKILTSKLSLRNHYKIHTGFDVVCEHCGKKFITRRLLLMHCRAKHGYEKTDKCSFCDYKASNAEQVKIHERLHTGEKPFVCAECGAGFHRKSSYLQHVAIHLPEKNVQCDQCPARFKSVTLMRIHKNRHRAATHAFRCGVCDNTFVRRRNVLRHLARIHHLPPDPLHVRRVDIA